MMNRQKARALKPFTRRFGAGFLLFATLIAAAHPALAVNAGGVIRNLDNSTLHMPSAIEFVAYVVGIFCLYSGIVAMKELSQEPGKKSIRPVVIRFMIAAMLIALPRTIVMVSKTLGNSGRAPTLNQPKMFR